MDNFLHDTIKYLNEIGLPVFLHGSTLLGIVREGHMLQRYSRDNELNIGCRAEDLTDEMLGRIWKDHNFVSFKNGMHKNNHLIFFSPHWKQEYRSQWEMTPGFTLLAPFYQEGNKRYEYMGTDIIKVWDSWHIDNPEEWDKIMYQGHRYFAPKDHEAWFTNYFGPTWKTEDRDWNWMGGAQNKRHWSTLYTQESLEKRG